jgi:sodium-independent sulfate anion transporter 11
MLIFTGNITQGLPELKLPPFEFYDSTSNQTVSFIDMCSTLGTGLIIVPLVALLENIAICKAFCKY